MFRILCFYRSDKGNGIPDTRCLGNRKHRHSWICIGLFHQKHRPLGVYSTLHSSCDSISVFRAMMSPDQSQKFSNRPSVAGFCDRSLFTIFGSTFTQRLSALLSLATFCSCKDFQYSTNYVNGTENNSFDFLKKGIKNLNIYNSCTPTRLNFTN